MSDLLWRAVREHVALVENQDALRHAHDQTEIVIDDHDARVKEAPKRADDVELLVGDADAVPDSLV